MAGRQRQDQPIVLVPAPPEVFGGGAGRGRWRRLGVALLLGGALGAAGSFVAIERDRSGTGDRAGWLEGEPRYLLSRPEPGEGPASSPDPETLGPGEVPPLDPSLELPITSSPRAAPEDTARERTEELLAEEEASAGSPQQGSQGEAPAPERGGATDEEAPNVIPPPPPGTAATSRPAGSTEADASGGGAGGSSEASERPEPDDEDDAASAPPGTSGSQSEPGVRDAERAASLYVQSHPWARVYVNGELVGTTPVVGFEVPAGLVLLRIEREGYAPYREELRVAPGAELRRTGIVLEEDP